jgi:hypothetical protein
MLEWKTRILTLLITLVIFGEEFEVFLRDNWNW